MDEASVEAFFAALAERAGTAPLSDEEAEAVLDLTRVVAHTVERRYAPLTVYAAALAWADLEPAARIQRLRDVAAQVRPVT